MLYYDNEGRVYRTRKLIDGVNYNIYHTYDALGRVKSIKYPDNETVAYTYDTGGNLSAVGGYATFPDAAYDALGQPGRISYGNGVLTTLLYNDTTNSRLQEISATSPVDGLLQDYGYSYDENGNITSITDSVDPAKNQTFQYDLLNRMTQATTANSPPIDLTYSRTGNITKNTRVGTSTWEYWGPAHPGAVKTAGTNSYTYDANGNMETRNDADLDYDYENRLIRITKGSAVNTYVYDYTGARIKKTTPTSATIHIGNLFEVKDGVATKHIFAGGRRIASKTGNSIYYFHPDHLGGLNVVTDNDGRNVQSDTYYPFGETRETTGSDILQYKFTGQENDPESGLYYYGARFYDPVIGRFITPDSIVQSPGDPQSLNRYAYCRNNPLIYTDPSGHIWQIIVGAIIGAIMSGIQSDWNPGAMIFGAMVGGISGGVFMGVQGAVSGALTGVVQNSVASGAISSGAGGMAAGVVSGGLNSLYYKGDIGEGILKGAAFGALSGAAFGALNGYLEELDQIPPAYSDADKRGPLSYSEMQELVAQNNLSSQSDEMIISIAYKESTFNPNAASTKSSATGLMGMTKAAAKDAGFNYKDMTNPEYAVQAGSKYLQLRINWASGDVTQGLAGYGTGQSYALQILRAELALKAMPNDPVSVLERILHK